MSDVGAADTGTVFANLLVLKEEGAVRIRQMRRADAGGGLYEKKEHLTEVNVKEIRESGKMKRKC
jgi:DNA-binding transcriptional regulator YiaG